MYQRLGAIGRGLGAGVAGCPFYFKSLPAGGFDLNSTVQVGEMARRMGELGPRLLCIDNLGVAKGARRRKHRPHDPGHVQPAQARRGMRGLRGDPAPCAEGERL